VAASVLRSLGSQVTEVPMLLPTSALPADFTWACPFQSSRYCRSAMAEIVGHLWIPSTLSISSAVGVPLLLGRSSEWCMTGWWRL
jgi:hypothetical protein